MPRLGCDTRIEKPSIDVADRVFDLRNRVTWLKNVEFCLLGDQTDRLTKIKAERHEMEMFSNDLRKQLKTSRTMMVQPVRKDMTIVEGIDYANSKRNRAMQEHNELLFIQRCLLDRLESLHDQTRTNQTNKKLVSTPTKQIEDTKTITHRIREIQNRLTSVKLINKTLNTCKQHLQCDLDLLRKELPNVQKDIGQKFHQRIILKKEFTDIVAENKRRLKVYQQLLDHTEAQSRQRRIIHEQAMTSIAEQLEDQYQVQMMAANNMTTSFETRKLTITSGPTTNIPLQQQQATLMTSDEIVQVRCMYDQFYNIIMAGLPIDIAHSEQLKTVTNDISAKTVAMITMTNRMMEEKEQITQQIHRTDKLVKLIEMSMNCKNDIRHQILNAMIEQRQDLELFYINDSIEEQNRIIRQINDFIIVLSKALCEHVGTQSVSEPSIDFIARLQYVFDGILKAVTTQSLDNDDYQTSPIHRRSGGIGEENSQILKETRSITSSLSSLSSHKKRNPMKTNLY